MMKSPITATFHHAMNVNPRIHVFGEVLFDTFADCRCVLGGAPFNVVGHLQAFGQT